MISGGFTCPAPEDLDPLARRFFPFPRFAVQGRNDLYIICVNDLPRLQACGAGSAFDPSTLSCAEIFQDPFIDQLVVKSTKK